jgi:hypothetical protein
MSISTPRVKHNPIPAGPERLSTAVLAAAFGLIVVWCAFWIGVIVLLMELVNAG